MALSDAGYAEMTQRLRQAMPRGAEGRLGIVLGGTVVFGLVTLFVVKSID